jgi:hypothetical protein
MLLFRGALNGLGEVPAPLTEGYCFDGGVWRWMPASACSTPVLPGGDPTIKPGFCWVRQSPPAAFPGYWQRARTGQSCAHQAPPSVPTVPAGFCYNAAIGRWEWVLASQCAQPVQAGVPPGESVRVTEVSVTTPMTLNMVERMRDAAWTNYWKRETLAVKAWTLQLSQCPAESVGPPACKTCPPACYNYGPTTMAATIPGTFEVYGVPFNVAEPGVTKSPILERIYTPNNEQRIFIESAIVLRSTRTFENALLTALQAQGPVALNVVRDQVIPQVPLQEILRLLPRWRLTVPGVALHAIEPTPAELTARGGFAAWIKRGGFLISLDVAEGQTGLADEATSPAACSGNSCRCGENVLPSCIMTGVPTADGPMGSFWWFVKIDQATGQFHLIGKHDDPGWLEKAAQPFVKFLTAFGNMVCTAQPQFQAQTQSSVAEKCTDKDGKPCTRGSAGCNCISPSAAATGGVGIFNFIAGKLCQGWLAEHTQDPSKVLPQVPDPAPISTRPRWLTFVPWILGGFAAGAGAFAISRR